MSAAPKWTPGPWRLEQVEVSARQTDLLVTVGPPTGTVIAEVNPTNALPVDMALANGALLSAAPDMAEALQAIIARVHGVFDDPQLIKAGPLMHHKDDDVVRIARGALAKARW